MIQIILSSANLGDMTDERDFDLWARYVAETIDAATGLVCEIDQAAFGDAGADQIRGATDDERETLRRWLSVDGWEAFCAGSWQAMAVAS